MTLSLDYTLCENAECPSAATCDRYRTLRQHFDRLTNATNSAEKIAAERNLDRVWISGFRPDITGKCEDYIRLPIAEPIHPPSSINLPSL